MKSLQTPEPKSLKGQKSTFPDGTISSLLGNTNLCLQRVYITYCPIWSTHVYKNSFSRQNLLPEKVKTDNFFMPSA